MDWQRHCCNVCTNTTRTTLNQLSIWHVSSMFHVLSHVLLWLFSYFAYQLSVPWNNSEVAFCIILWVYTANSLYQWAPSIMHISPGICLYITGPVKVLQLSRLQWNGSSNFAGTGSYLHSKVGHTHTHAHTHTHTQFYRHNHIHMYVVS